MFGSRAHHSTVYRTNWRMMTVLSEEAYGMETSLALMVSDILEPRR